MLRRAFARVWHRPLLVVALAVLDLMLAGGAVQPLSAALAGALDRRPAAARAVAGDDALLAELAQDEPALLDVATRSGEVAGALRLVLGAVLAGGIVAVLVAGDRRSLWTACGAHAPRMLRLAGVGLLCRAGVGTAVGALAGGLPWRHQPGVALAVTAALLVPAWALLTVLIGYARAIAIAGPTARVRRALVAALAVAARSPGRTLLLVACAGATWSVGIIAELALGFSGLSASGGALTLLAAVGVALAWAFTDAVTMVAAGLVALAPSPAPSIIPFSTAEPPTDGRGVALAPAAPAAQR